jgi:hypothetical protein
MSLPVGLPVALSQPPFIGWWHQPDSANVAMTNTPKRRSE